MADKRISELTEVLVPDNGAQIPLVQDGQTKKILYSNLKSEILGATTPSTGKFTILESTGQADLGTASTNYISLRGASGAPTIRTISASTAGLGLSSSGSGAINFYTNSVLQEQMRVAHTASAVNYVQVTGAATGIANTPLISAQGSDATVNLSLSAKGGGDVIFLQNGVGTPRILTLSTVSGAVNYFNITPSTTNTAPKLSPIGTDTNISMGFVSKGTGAIDLAAGSSGVNISNGGTVTAITRTATGSGYTSVPSVAISAPTTAGGVQATASVAMEPATITIASGGSGYTLNDVLTFVGGTVGSQSTQVTVTGVSGGVITSVNQTRFGRYTALPTNPISVTGGTGSGATFNVTAYIITNEFTITNAGSGYIEQPTVTFSGGGGSGASAYATVGGNTTVRGIGTTTGASITFSTPAGDAVKIADAGASTTNFIYMGTGATPFITSQGTNAPLALSSNGTGTLWLRTNGAGTNQLAVSHTASAVNYVQVTGAATGNTPAISAQGSDANINLLLNPKGTGQLNVFINNGSQFRVSNTASAVNYLEARGNIASNAPILSAQGSDTNIDLSITTKGTGAVRFNTGGGEQVQIINKASTINTLRLNGNSTGAGPDIMARGGDASVNLNLASFGAGNIDFFTNHDSFVRQFRVSHTASAVNYVQVTGGVTGSPSQPVISAQGSDANINIALQPKGTGASVLLDSSGGGTLRAIPRATGGDTFLDVQRAVGFVDLIAGNGLSNGDIRLTPKGTGNVRFGTHTATADTAISGYIEIKDASGTVRKLAVIS